jgi:hypothetical protein
MNAMHSTNNMKVLLSDFLTSNLGELHLKIVSIQVIPPHAAQTKMWREFAELPLKNNEVPFWGSLAQ